MDIRSRVMELRDEVVSLRRDFHKHPELGFREYRTAEKIEEYLRNLGLEPERIAGTGVAALIEGSEPGPVLLLRADMDALPIQEENDLPYASVTEGVMHACGHDAHTAMLLTAVRILTERREGFSGTVMALFQPNEEVAGAERLVEQGLFSKLEPDGALALHIWTPLPTGTVGLKAGAVMASIDFFEILVQGRGGHTGYPELTRDPVIAAADIVKNAQVLQTRETAADLPMSVMFGKVAAGTKSNIVPNEARLEGTLRFLFPAGAEGGTHPVERLRRIAEASAEVHRCSASLRVVQENRAVVNDERMVEVIRDAASQAAGVERIEEHSSMAGEDFSAISTRYPSAFVFLGTASAEGGSGYPHHHPRFDIDEASLPIGVELLVRGTLEFLGRGGIW